ncbi:hypothetical protein ABW20_dc0101253 [Dactylellina cionopaga]|nr:hypothetical protein ABW20_dc0101253 [Dactylellina cionopaga]
MVEQLPRLSGLTITQTETVDMVLLALRSPEEELLHLTRIILQNSHAFSINPFHFVRFIFGIVSLRWEIRDFKAWLSVLTDTTAFPRYLKLDNGDKIPVKPQGLLSFLAWSGGRLSQGIWEQSINYRGIFTQRPLFLYQILYAHTEVIESILERGVNPQKSDVWGSVIHLMIGIEKLEPDAVIEFEDKIKLLLRYGVDLELRNQKTHQTALEYACSGSRLESEFIDTLLDAGACVTPCVCLNSIASRNNDAQEALKTRGIDVDGIAASLLEKFKTAVLTNSLSEIDDMIKNGFQLSLVLANLEQYKEELMNLDTDSVVKDHLLNKLLPQATKSATEVEEALTKVHKEIEQSLTALYGRVKTISRDLKQEELKNYQNCNIDTIAERGGSGLEHSDTEANEEVDDTLDWNGHIC